MSVEDNQLEYIVIWEQPKMEPPEFRLYYDENGAEYVTPVTNQ